MEEYKPNSHKSKQDVETKKVDKIVTGIVKTKKKNEVQKLADMFISEDAPQVKSVILMDIIIPTIKKVISDIVTNGVDIILYGGAGNNNRGSQASKISYRQCYDRNNRTLDPRDLEYSRPRKVYDYDDIIIESRGEAEEVLMRMEELVSTYGKASIGDFKDLVGITGNYTDNNYGWMNLRDADVIRLRSGGFMIKFPRAIALN